MNMEKPEDMREEREEEFLLVLVVIYMIKQESESCRMILVDTCNGFNGIKCLLMLCTVRHTWHGLRSIATSIGCFLSSSIPVICRPFY